jgi:hypothetical protein
MSFSLVTQAEKLRSLNSAKADFQAEIYKNIAKLGFDPDTYDMSTWNFDPVASSIDDDPGYGMKSSITSGLARIASIDAKIAELS